MCVGERYERADAVEYHQSLENLNGIDSSIGHGRERRRKFLWAAYLEEAWDDTKFASGGLDRDHRRRPLHHPERTHGGRFRAVRRVADETAP